MCDHAECISAGKQSLIFMLLCRYSLGDRCPRTPNPVIPLMLRLLPLSLGKKYGLRNGGGKMLSSNGSLVPDVTPETLYSLEVNSGLVAFRDDEGKYLTGREGGVRGIKMDKPGRDELFTMESSPAQVSMRSLSTSKFICCRPGETGKKH